MSNQDAIIKHNPVNVPSYIPVRKSASETIPGLENMRAQDIVIPRLVLMQAMSPKAKAGEAREGELWLSNGVKLSDKDKSITFIPIMHYIDWIEWKQPRGTGMVGRTLDPKSAMALSAARRETIVDSKGRDIPKVTEYHNFVCIIPELVGPNVPVCISCAKSNYKHGKNLLSMAMMKDAALYSSRYVVKAKNTPGPDGSTYCEFSFECVGWVSEEEFDLGKGLYEKVKTWYSDNRLVTEQGEDDFESSELIEHGNQGPKNPNPTF